MGLVRDRQSERDRKGAEEMKPDTEAMYIILEEQGIMVEEKQAEDIAECFKDHLSLMREVERTPYIESNKSNPIKEELKRKEKLLLEAAFKAQRDSKSAWSEHERHRQSGIYAGLWTAIQEIRDLI